MKEKRNAIRIITLLVLINENPINSSISNQIQSGTILFFSDIHGPHEHKQILIYSEEMV
jgi:hypothetical protein